MTDTAFQTRHSVRLILFSANSMMPTLLSARQDDGRTQNNNYYFLSCLSFPFGWKKYLHAKQLFAHNFLYFYAISCSLPDLLSQLSKG